MSEQLYLEVCKKTTAIVGATTTPYESPSYDLVKCSAEEFNFLNLLSDTLPEGWAVSLSDLETYRENKTKASAKARAKPAVKAPKPSQEKSSSKSTGKASPAKNEAAEGLIADIKKFRTNPRKPHNAK
ncbi:hypothetical protein [Metapseudomonas furukawaii]